MKTRFRKLIGREIPGGWHYQIPSGPMVKGESVDDLVKAVITYRVSNGMRSGNPLPEILDYYAKTFPFTVENCEDQSEYKADTLKDHVHQWTNDAWKTPCHDSADPDVIISRCDFCRECQHRRDVSVEDNPEDHEIERRIILMAKGIPCDDDVGWCAHHWWDNRLVALWPKDRVNKMLSSECPWPR